MSANVPPRPGSNLRSALLVALIFAAMGIWAVIAFNTGNALWFLPFQPSHEPSRIIIRNFGTSVDLRPNDAGFRELSDALNMALSEFKNSTQIPLGLSEETLQYYHDLDLVIEVYYPEPIRFNTSARLTGITQILVPINGRHDGQGYAFMGTRTGYGGPMVMADPSPLLEVLRTLGYDVDRDRG